MWSLGFQSAKMFFNGYSMVFHWFGILALGMKEQAIS